jgi:acyl-coenzyme A thioesterase PaaI-like protein
MSGDATPDFDEQACEALRALVATTRRLNEVIVTSRADIESLDAARASVESAIAKLTPHAGTRALPRYRYQERAVIGMNGVLPYSPVTGHYSPLAPPVIVTREGDVVVGRVRFSQGYEGPPSSVHGGIVSAVWDQLLAMAALARDLGGPTASLTIDYKRPTPLETDLEFRAWTTEVDGRKVRTRGECYANGELVTTATALFILIAGTRAAENFDSAGK